MDIFYYTLPRYQTSEHILYLNILPSVIDHVIPYEILLSCIHILVNLLSNLCGYWYVVQQILKESDALQMTRGRAARRFLT